jgi:hypothetical protein
MEFEAFQKSRQEPISWCSQSEMSCRLNSYDPQALLLKVHRSNSLQNRALASIASLAKSTATVFIE